MSMDQDQQAPVDEDDRGDDALVDDELDALIADLDEPEALPHDADAPATTPTAATPARAGNEVRTRAFARRVAAKAQQLAGADEEDLTALSALLGVSGDTVDLTVAVMTGDRTAVTVAGDVERIAAADPFSAAVTAQETGRARMKAVAALLHALGETASATLNGSDAKAAIAVAQGVHRMSPTAKARLERAAALARRTV